MNDNFTFSKAIHHKFVITDHWAQVEKARLRRKEKKKKTKLKSRIVTDKGEANLNMRIKLLIILRFGYSRFAYKYLVVLTSG